MQEDEGRDPPPRVDGMADKGNSFTNVDPTFRYAGEPQFKIAEKSSFLGSWAVIIVLLILAGALTVFLIR
jgi:hypothetical protein